MADSRRDSEEKDSVQESAAEVGDACTESAH